MPTAVPDLPPSPFAASLDWARHRLDRPIGVDEWARVAGTSTRTFARWFHDATGSTPARWLARERVRRAQELLEASDLAVETVAARCGFSTAAGLRRPFLREVGTTPQEYRRTFGRRPRAASSSP